MPSLLSPILLLGDSLNLKWSPKAHMLKAWWPADGWALRTWLVSGALEDSESEGIIEKWWKVKGKAYSERVGVVVTLSTQGDLDSP